MYENIKNTIYSLFLFSLRTVTYTTVGMENILYIVFLPHQSENIEKKHSIFIDIRDTKNNI